MSEDQALLQPSDDLERPGPAQRGGSWREWTAKKLQTKIFRHAVISLITLDSIMVLVDLSYTYLSSSCGPKDVEPFWINVLSKISYAFSYLFLIELLVSAWAFGIPYYNPFRSILHFCDGSIIILTFMVDVVLRGRQRELASLLIIFRLLRFAGEAAVGVGELNEATSEELQETKEALAEKTRELHNAQQEIQYLKAKMATLSNNA